MPIGQRFSGLLRLWKVIRHQKYQFSPTSLRLLYSELSQGELVKRLGISQSMLSKYEKGKVGLTLEVAVKYTEVFNMSLGYISFGED